MTEVCCERCGAGLSADEIALHRKLFNRGAASFWCLHCQAEYLGSTREQLQALIDRYHETGECMLFTKKMVET